jgi:hypothetical protein
VCLVWGLSTTNRDAHRLAQGTWEAHSVWREKQDGHRRGYTFDDGKYQYIYRGWVLEMGSGLRIPIDPPRQSNLNAGETNPSQDEIM